MKYFSFSLAAHHVESFFKPVRDRIDAVHIILAGLRLILSETEIEDSQKKGEMVLKVSKMSWLFFFAEKKYFSLNFPFQVVEVEGQLKFYSDHFPAVNSEIVSRLQTILNDNNMVRTGTSLNDFFDAAFDHSSEENKIWNQFWELINLEEGYVRFDHDPERSSSENHPLNHLDIFYSNPATFKVGLDVKISKEKLIDILDVETECMYLKNKIS